MFLSSKLSWRALKDLFLDTLFPIECFICGKEGKWLCEDCFAAIDMDNKHICPLCGANSFLGKLCLNCKNEHLLDGLIYVAEYSGFLEKMIKGLKYKYAYTIAPVLSKLLYKRFSLFEMEAGIKFYLTPVPLYSLRERERGFNQAELILGEFPPENILKNVIRRIRYTSTQTKFDKKHRRENLKDAFVIEGSELVKNRNIILVDDVFTSGVTMEECAKVLKSVGAKSVWGLVLAKKDI